MNKSIHRYLRHLPSLSGKTCVVTGGTGSIAKALVEDLLFLGADVVLTYRSEDKARRLVSELGGLSDRIHAVFLDLSSKDSVLSFLQDLPRRIDLFFHVAGTYHRPMEFTPEGREVTYQTDFLAPAWIDGFLLREHPEARIIHTGSVSMYYSKVDFQDPMSLKVGKTIRYGRDKRLLALYVLFLQERYPDGSYVLAHPGVSATSLFQSEKGGFSKTFERLLVPVMKRVFMKPEKAALCLVLAAFSGEGRGELVAPRGFLHSWGKPRVLRLRKSLLESDERLLFPGLWEREKL